MLFELLSTGEMVALPNEPMPGGLPEGVDPRVVLLAPYNRALVGTDVLGCYERWLWGKLGSSEWEEVALYDDLSKAVEVSLFGKVTMKEHLVTRLRHELLATLSPPGEHDVTALILRETLKEEENSVLATLCQDEESLQELVQEDEMLRTAYWGFRVALLWGGQDMLKRVKTWLRLARTSFDSALHRPRLWVFLTGEPDEASLNDLLSIGFRVEPLKALDSEDANPAVLKGPGGYIIQLWYEGMSRKENDRPAVPVRVWLYLTSELWNDLRGKRGLSIREMVFAAWGYLEALDAAARMSRYGPHPLTTSNR